MPILLPPCGCRTVGVPPLPDVMDAAEEAAVGRRPCAGGGADLAVAGHDDVGPVRCRSWAMVRQPTFLSAVERPRLHISREDTTIRQAERALTCRPTRLARRTGSSPRSVRYRPPRRRSGSPVP